MNEDEARQLLRSTYPIPESSTLAWRPWIEHPVAPRPPRRALLAAIIAAVVVVVIALPVGVTLALHQPPLHSTPPGVVSPGATCAIADGVTSAEFDRVSASKQNFVFPDSVPDHEVTLVSATSRPPCAPCSGRFRASTTARRKESRWPIPSASSPGLW